jgi:hypothetical protein
MQTEDEALGFDTAPLWSNEKGSKAMTTLELESNEDSILNYEISDEALESAGDNVASANYTLGACTGLSICPG